MARLARLQLQQKVVSGLIFFYVIHKVNCDLNNINKEFILHLHAINP